MANELRLFADVNTQSGLTVTCKVYTTLGVQQGSDVSCTEVGTDAIYLGDMPAASSGLYVLRFFNGTDMISQAEFNWDGSNEIIPGNTIIEGSITDLEAKRIMLSVLAGKVSGAGTGREVFRDTTDSKDRVIASVDSNGNRKAITLDGA